MNPSERLNIITSIALHLQEEYTTSEINLILGGYGIETENVSIVNSKRIYIVDLLKCQANDLIIKIEKDLMGKETNEITSKSSKVSRRIFISHSSKNSDFGNALVELLIGIGIKDEQIIFTSNTAYGIPIGVNIFNWLKNRINENPFVIYLLSPEYYSSVACLNEMGAAWVIENDHAMLFTPDFQLETPEFQNGVLDPREIGFYINNEDRLTSFIESLKKTFEISANQVLVNQKSKNFITQINSISKNVIKTKSLPQKKLVANEISLEKNPIKQPITNKNNAVIKFFDDLENDKLKDEEIILIHYISDTDKYKLGTGWQTSNEIEYIKTWEDIKDYNNILSNNYEKVLRRFAMKKLIYVSELTSNGNPKEVCIIEELQNKLFDLPNGFNDKLNNVSVKSNEINVDDDLPF